MSDVSLVKAINLLLEWFEHNPHQGRDLFSEIYRKRAEIFMNTIKDRESLYKVMQSCTNLAELVVVADAIEDDPEIIQKLHAAKEVDDLLEEFQVDNISDLKEMLRQARNVIYDDINEASDRVEVSNDILLSLGISSEKELREALKTKEFSAKFFHESTPTLEMFLAVEEYIQRAKVNVLDFLESLESYDCTNAEDLAPTVIGGIEKDGSEISIIVRPSDNGEVIIYYSSEKDYLDEPGSELWIDNGFDDPEQLTLGKFLKVTGINRIPVE